jgi:hypothetical protein
MKIFRRKKGDSPKHVNSYFDMLRYREPSAFEVKLRARLNAMPREQQYRLVIIGMLIIVMFIALRIAIAVYKLSNL